MSKDCDSHDIRVGLPIRTYIASTGYFLVSHQSRYPLSCQNRHFPNRMHGYQKYPRTQGSLSVFTGFYPFLRFLLSEASENPSWHSCSGAWAPRPASEYKKGLYRGLLSYNWKSDAKDDEKILYKSQRWHARCTNDNWVELRRNRQQACINAMGKCAFVEFTYVLVERQKHDSWVWYNDFPSWDLTKCVDLPY